MTNDEARMTKEVRSPFPSIGDRTRPEPPDGRFHGRRFGTKNPLSLVLRQRSFEMHGLLSLALSSKGGEGIPTGAANGTSLPLH